jgi:hypothetical protein
VLLSSPNLLLQFGLAHRFLVPPLAHKCPEPIAAAELELLIVQALNSNHQRNRFVVTHDDDLFALSCQDALVQGPLLDINGLHSISCVVG